MVHPPTSPEASEPDSAVMRLRCLPCSICCKVGFGASANGSASTGNAAIGPGGGGHTIMICNMDRPKPPRPGVKHGQAMRTIGFEIVQIAMLKLVSLCQHLEIWHMVNKNRWWRCQT